MVIVQPMPVPSLEKGALVATFDLCVQTTTAILKTARTDPSTATSDILPVALSVHFVIQQHGGAIASVLAGVLTAVTMAGPLGCVLPPNLLYSCLLYTSPSPRDATLSRMPSSA